MGQLMKRHLQHVFDEVRPKAVMCKVGPYYSDRSQAYFRYEQQQVDLGRTPSWADFLPHYQVGIDDEECDPRRYSLNFAMRERLSSGEIIGAFMFYNVTIKDVSADRVTVSGYPAPGFPIHGNEDWAETLSYIIRFFLSTDLELEDGRVLDMDEAVFPTEDPRAVWEDAPAVTRLLVESDADGRTVERKDTRLHRIRK
jgi:hypothetical protein